MGTFAMRKRMKEVQVGPRTTDLVGGFHIPRLASWCNPQNVTSWVHSDFDSWLPAPHVKRGRWNRSKDNYPYLLPQIPRLCTLFLAWRWEMVGPDGWQSAGTTWHWGRMEHFLLGRLRAIVLPLGSNFYILLPWMCSRVHVATLGIEAAVLIIDMQ